MTDFIVNSLLVGLAIVLIPVAAVCGAVIAVAYAVFAVVGIAIGAPVYGVVYLLTRGE